MDLPTKLRSWLATEGYPFELRMGRLLRESGWSVFHGRYYTDPTSGKLREIDLHAMRGPYAETGTDLTSVGLVSVSLICECKTSHDKPWVIFTSPTGDDSPSRMVGDLAPGSLPGRALAHALLTTSEDVSSFLPGPRIGHGVAKAFVDSKGGDPTAPFAAIAGAIAAASAFSQEHLSRVRRGTSDTTWIAIYVPVVIVSGLLFEFYLDENGREVLEPCDRIHVLAPDTGPAAGHLLVPIIAETAMAPFARQAAEAASAIAHSVLPENRRLWKQFRESPEALAL